MDEQQREWRMYHYPIAIEPGDDQHAFGVSVPDLAGCFSAGETLEEAIEQAHEAIKFHLEGLCEDGDLPPTPNTHSAYIEQYQGHIWGVASIDETPYMGKSEKINVTLPTLVKLQIDEFTKSHKTFKSRSHFLQIAARELLEKA